MVRVAGEPFRTYILRLLLIDAPNHQLPPALEIAARAVGWEVAHAGSCHDVSDALIGCDAALLAPPLSVSGDRSTSGLDKLVERLVDRHIPTLIYAPEWSASPLPRGDFVEVVGSGFSAAELRGRFAMIERYQKHIVRLEHELSNMSRLGRQLHDHFQDLDQEMRLAARLQRGFLPCLGEPIQGVRFASLFRPATWVSGDIFDVFRVDDEHTAFYLADAVGHGVASGLLTIFIKQGMVATEMDGGVARLVSPQETLAGLNRTLVKLALPNCQFVTAWYGLLNHRTMRLRYARGGHPYPVLMSRDGTVRELQSGGGLLGIMEEETFDLAEVQLHPGDKLAVYSDGLECSLPALPGAAQNMFAPVDQFKALGSGSIETLFERLESRVNDQGGSLCPQDDLTILGLEVLDSTS